MMITIESLRASLKSSQTLITQAAGADAASKKCLTEISLMIVREGRPLTDALFAKNAILVPYVLEIHSSWSSIKAFLCLP
jgi:hypothetical protein